MSEMNEMPKGSEQRRQPEEIQLGQEFYPYRDVQSTDTDPGIYHVQKDYKLHIPNNHLFVEFNSWPVRSEGWEIKPFGTGYTVDHRDFDLKSRKKKLAAAPLFYEFDTEAPLNFALIMLAKNLVQSGMASIRRDGMVQLINKVKKPLSLLRASVSANGKYEGRILNFKMGYITSPNEGLYIEHFYPVDAGPLAGKNSFNWGDPRYPNRSSASPGHFLLLPNNKELLDQVGIKFYLDREATQKQRFQEE